MALPHMGGFLAAALVGRLAYGVVGLALLLLVQRSTESYAAAGVAMVAFGLGAALLAPRRGRFVDRRGMRIALPLLTTAYATSLLCLTAAASLQRTPSAGLVLLCGLAGCFAPPLGPATRTIWARVVGDPSALRKAYSLDTVAEEVLFALGPLLAAVVVATAGVRAGIFLTIALVVAGTGGMLLSPLLVRPHAPADEPTVDEAARPATRDRFRGWRSPPFRQVLIVTVAVGAGLGGIELVAVAFADEHGTTTSAGLLLTALSAGSALGGVAYGTRTWTHPVATHLTLIAGATALGLAGLAALAALPSVYVFSAGLFLSGLFVAPLIVAAYTRADELSLPSNRTEAGALVNTYSNLGGSAGTAATGLLLDRAGTSATLVLAAGLVAVGTMLSAQGTGRRRQAARAAAGAPAVGVPEQLSGWRLRRR